MPISSQLSLALVHSANDGLWGCEIARIPWEHTTWLDTPRPLLSERCTSKVYLRQLPGLYKKAKCNWQRGETERVWEQMRNGLSAVDNPSEILLSLKTLLSGLRMCACMLAGVMEFPEWISGPNDSPTHPFPYIYLWRGQIDCSPFLTATEKIWWLLSHDKKER